MNLVNWVKNGLMLLKMVLIIVLLLGLSFDSRNDIINESLSFNKTLSLSASAHKEWEDINKDPYATKKTLTGSLTGYSADCPKCYGTLACKRSYKVYQNGVVTYNDKTYGNVRIVASSKNLKCGSVIRFKSNRVSKDVTYAIVLDRGVLGNDIDLLVTDSSYAIKYIGRSTITYEVVRNGWKGE